MAKKVAPKTDAGLARLPAPPWSSAEAAARCLFAEGFDPYVHASRGWFDRLFADRPRRIAWRRPVRRLADRLARFAAELEHQVARVEAPPLMKAGHLTPIVHAIRTHGQDLGEMLDRLPRDDWQKRALRALLLNARNLRERRWTRDPTGHPKATTLPRLTPRAVALIAIARGGELPCRSAGEFAERRDAWKKRLQAARAEIGSRGGEGSGPAGEPISPPPP